jgi:hypothetical protein
MQTPEEETRLFRMRFVALFVGRGLLQGWRAQNGCLCNERLGKRIPSNSNFGSQDVSSVGLSLRASLDSS